MVQRWSRALAAPYGVNPKTILKQRKRPSTAGAAMGPKNPKNTVMANLPCFSPSTCDENGIEHRLTKPYHPWTSNQAERMNRTVKDATIKTCRYANSETLKAHVVAFVSAYSFAISKP